MAQASDAAVWLDDLLAEMAWVRRLARALVKEPAAADDVAQDAWLRHGGEQVRGAIAERQRDSSWATASGWGRTPRP
jgi:DNA-directed RNA polymerase specialized sigma24 family protein